MPSDKNNRRSSRNELPYEIKLHFPGDAKEITATPKDISASGARVIIAGRLVKAAELPEIKIRIKDRDIVCKGKVAWVLMLRFGLGNVRIFDAGLEFTDMDPADKEFLRAILEPGSP